MPRPRGKQHLSKILPHKDANSGPVGFVPADTILPGPELMTVSSVVQVKYFASFEGEASLVESRSEKSGV